MNCIKTSVACIIIDNEIKKAYGIYNGYEITSNYRLVVSNETLKFISNELNDGKVLMSFNDVRIIIDDSLELGEFEILSKVIN